VFVWKLHPHVSIVPELSFLFPYYCMNPTDSYALRSVSCYS